MKKMMKKLIAMAAALVMIVTLLPAVGAKAEETSTSVPTINWDADASIKIKKTTTTPNEELNEGKFNIYLVATLDNVNGNQLTYTPVDNAGITKAEIADLGNMTATELEAKANAVFNSLKSNSVAPINGMTPVTGGDTQQINQFGLYLVEEAEAPEGYIAGAPFFVDVPRTNGDGTDWMYNVEVTPKNAATDLDLTKTVDNQTVEPGATVNYTIDGSLAYLSAAELEDENAKITLKDEMSDTLTIGSDNEGNPYDNTNNPLKITIHNRVTGEEDLVTVTIDDDRHGFTLNITGEDLEKYNGQHFSITYPVNVSDDFTATSEANNTVTIDSTGDGEKVDKEVNLYTFAIGIVKTGNDGTVENPKYLNGVKFELYNDDNGAIGTTRIDEGITENGGLLTFDGLDADKEGTTYWLKEVETVDGYTLLANPVKITLYPVYDDAQEIYTGALGYKIADGTELSTTSQNPRLAVVDITNNKGFTLPSTGGMGTYLFTIGGIVIMAGAAFALIAMKKRA